MNNVVRIEPKSRYDSEHSDPAAHRFVFPYTMTVYNDGPTPIQLMSRAWKITDADAGIQQVQGDGVVGQQPIILPKQFFTYESFCVLPTPLGWMEGFYQFNALIEPHRDFPFKSPIPRFVLEVPGIRQ